MQEVFYKIKEDPFKKKKDTRFLETLVSGKVSVIYIYVLVKASEST